MCPDPPFGAVRSELDPTDARLPRKPDARPSHAGDFLGGPRGALRGLLTQQLELPKPSGARTPDPHHYE